MNIVDALVVTFGIDASEYEKKQKEIATSLTKMGEVSGKQTKLIAESGKKAAGAFSALKVEILGALAAFGMGAGFKAFIESSINGQAELGRLSTRLGMSTHTLQAWKLAAQEMGGAGSDATNALQSVAKGLAEARVTGTSSLIQASRRFGFDVSNDPAQTLMNISRRMAQMHDPQQALQVAEAAGISNTAMQNLLLQGPDALQSRLAHTMALTGAATRQSTEQAARLQAQWADLQERFRQVGERVFNKLEPVLAKLGEQFANWLDHVDWNKVIAAIGAFIDKVQSVVKEMGGWKAVAEILGGIMAIKILAPIIGLVVNMGKLVPLLAGATGGVTALTAAMRLLGPAVAAVGGYYVGSKLSDMLDKFEQYGFGDKNQTYGGALYDAFHKFNPKTGKVEFDLWGGFRTWNQFHADQAAEKAYLYGPHPLSKLPPLSASMAKQEQASAMQYLISQGLTQAQAAGIVGNLMQESGMRAKAVGPDGKHFGLAQWGGSRIADFNAYSKHMGWGVDLQNSTSMQQLQFLMYEMHHKESRAYGLLKSTTDAAHAAVAMQAYERQGVDGTLGRRVHYAELANAAYPGARATQSGKTSTHTSTVSIGTMHVNAPKATDANGIAKDMGKSLRNNPLIAGSVTALN